MRSSRPCHTAWLLLFAVPLAVHGAETALSQAQTVVPPLARKATAAPAQTDAGKVDPITGAEPAEGFGAKATGGKGCEEVAVTNFAEFVKAINRSNVYIRVKGDIVATGNGIGKGSNITIDGGGTATIWGSAHNAFERQCELYGKNIVIKDIHFRNSGDNLGFKAPAENILISHVTTSASLDDGMSISYGTKNITIQYCFFVGCTRSCFIKYQKPQNITLHHNWFKAQLMRGPLISGALNVDVRNQLGEDWWAWGGPRFEKGSTGNCVNSVFVMTGASPGKRDAADYVYRYGGSDNVSGYLHGSIYRGCSGRLGNLDKEVPCAPVKTQPAEEVEATVRAKAGCLPRNELDQKYSAMMKWGPMNERKPVLFQIGPDTPLNDTPISGMLVPNDKEAARKKAAGSR